MFLKYIKHNLIIIFCILLMINGCNDENSKLIIENNNKAEKTNKPVTRRLKRQRVSNQNTIQNDDNYVGWQQSLHKTEEKTISKEELINNIRFAIDNIHENKLAVKHPFENIIKIQVLSPLQNVKILSKIEYFKLAGGNFFFNIISKSSESGISNICSSS